MPQRANPFWRFSLRTYRAPGVADACLALQDQCGADVNLLLFCGWLGRRGERLDRHQIRQAMARVGAWQSSVIAPLRQARRALKQQHDSAAAAMALPFRRRLAAIELDLERAEQRLLAQLVAQWETARAKASAQQTTHDNLAHYLELLAPGTSARHAAQLACIARACSPASARRRVISASPTQQSLAPGGAVRSKAY